MIDLLKIETRIVEALAFHDALQSEIDARIAAESALAGPHAQTVTSLFRKAPDRGVARQRSTDPMPAGIE